MQVSLSLHLSPPNVYCYVSVMYVYMYVLCMHVCVYMYVCIDGWMDG
jgi:hypothetical protein